MDISVGDVRQAMTELGELRFGATPVDEAMHRIVQTTHAIFDVDGAGLMLVDADDQLRNAAVSDARFDHLEQLQITHHEGPCISAYEDKQLVCAEDLDEDARWPAFTAAALSKGIRAVLASPIPYNQQAIGVVGVVSEDRRPWSPEGELALLAFTDLAALLIASMLHAEKQSDLAAQLQGALDSRAVIEQAKGVLMREHGVSARAAFELLRAQARRERRRLAGVAADIVQNTHRAGTDVRT
ncbi:MAG: putative Transcriptional activator protein traR [Jatrophihabitans sp.]|jgi:GAF domain-containing protein|nr:putative Transcriptional activator protein traR [Jatrophihabitans sp.]